MKPKKPKKLQSYHFDLGNTNKGSVGACGRVIAESKEEALAILKEALPEEIELKSFCTEEQKDKIEYFNVYINTGNIKLRHLGDVEDVEIK